MRSSTTGATAHPMLDMAWSAFAPIREVADDSAERAAELEFRIMALGVLAMMVHGFGSLLAL